MLFSQEKNNQLDKRKKQKRIITSLSISKEFEKFRNARIQRSSRRVCKRLYKI